MLEVDVSIFVLIFTYDVEPDVFMPIDFMDIVIGHFDEKFSFCVDYEFLSIAKSSSTSELHFYKYKNSLVLKNQVDFCISMPVIGYFELITFAT